MEPCARGELRTYPGIAPGAGKTYAMLRDGRARRRGGVDGVVAFWQRHGRAAAAAEAAGLEVLTGTVTCRGVNVTEPDVAAVPDRHPALALVDELARANLPGARHPKRWQDAGELLDSGIDACAALNVASIESPGPLVSRVTGVPRPSRCQARSYGPARSSWSTLPRRRCAAGWPGGWSSPQAGRITPPGWPGCPAPGCRACTSGLSTTWTGRPGRGWRRTGGCSASCTGRWPRSRPATRPRD